MKHIKKFENKKSNRDYYWLLPTDDRFEDSLKLINCPNNKIYNFLNNNNIDNKYVFIGYNASKYYWGWNTYNNNINDKYYDELHYKFMGLVNIDPIEFETNKFNI